MNQKYITKMITECHKFFVDRGDYRCICEDALLEKKRLGAGGHRECDCEICNNTGTHCDISEILLEIIGCLWKAADAYKKNRVCELNIEGLDLVFRNDGELCLSVYEGVKNTFEDHLAAAFIRLFDLCGYLGIKVEYYGPIRNNRVEKYKTLPKFVYDIIFLLPREYKLEIDAEFQDDLIYFYTALFHFGDDKNIDIQKHISAKLEYMRATK